MNANRYEEVVARADALAASRPELRYMLREVAGSRWCTGTFVGSSRAPSLAQLVAAVERAEAAGLSVAS